MRPTRWTAGQQQGADGARPGRADDKATTLDVRKRLGERYIFLGCILALVAYLSITRRDATEQRQPPIADVA